MAMLKWGQDDEENKDELLNVPTIKTVNSVQSSWQPTADGTLAADDTPQSGNYLMSAEKAQFDEGQRQRKAAEAAAAAQAAQEAAMARAEANARAAAAQEVQAAQSPTPAAGKYGGGQKKNEGGFKGFLKDVASGIQQSGAALGDIAIQGGGVIGSIGKNDKQLVKHLAEVEKVRGWLHSGKDINSNNFVGTRDVDQNAANIAAGRGNLRDFTAVGGKSLQAGVDATMFMNPARLALGGLKPVATQGGKLIPRLISSPAVRFAARDAGFYGGLQGAATAASSYGETGDLAESLKAGARDAAIAAVLQGSMDLGVNAASRGARQIPSVANKTFNSLRKPRELRIGDEIAQGIEGGLEEGIQAPTQRPNEVADGIVTTPQERPAAPAQDNNVSFTKPVDQPQVNEPLTNDLTPVADGVPQLPEQAAPQLPEQTPVDAANLTPIEQAPTPVNEVTPVADGTVQPRQPMNTDNMPTIPSEQVRALQDARAGKSQADEAVINQELQQLESQKPTVEGNSPESRAGIKDTDSYDTKLEKIDKAVDDETITFDEAGKMEDDLFEVENKAGRAMAEDGSLPDGVNDAPLPDGKLTPAQVAERLMPKLASAKELKTNIARAVGMEKDVESSLAEILANGSVKPARADRITKQYDKFKKSLADYNQAQDVNQKAYAEGGADAVNIDTSKSGRRAGRELGIATRRIMSEIKQIEGSKDMKSRLVGNLIDAIGTRNANVLTSAGLLERNIFQEITANTKLVIKNPIKTAKSTFNNGNIVGSTIKSELSHWGDRPANILNPVQISKYIIGNTYRTGMIPTTVLANTRRGAVRDELTQWAYKELTGQDLSAKEAHKLAGTAGNEMEALVNTFMGVDNGMTNRKQATDAMEAWKEYIRSGDTGAKAEYLKRVEDHNSLADQMISGLSKEDKVKARGLMAMKNLIFPFVRTATNLAKNTFRQDLNPKAKSLIDEIRADQRGGGKNAINLIKSKLVDYGILGGAAMLATSDLLVYNDGDEVDKPRGWAFKVGDDIYVPVRSTSLELPVAMAGTAQQMAKDIMAGKPREASYYSGMVVGSLPYIDQFNTTTGAVDSVMNGEDGGYAAKSYGVNTAKSFTPWTNNGLQAYVAGKKGESLNAKTVYDKDLAKWFGQTIRKSYDADFYNSLKDSRDNAGRVRTVDNQGILTNKTINDSSTAEFNDRVTDLVKYGRENGLGKETKDMFDTYNKGKNNNFKTIQGSIWAATGKGGNDTKLEKNDKLSDLSSQIREGFYGTTGDDLLTLDGKNLYSDVSMPNANGTKNSSKPINMQSIKNAIAATDLPDDKQARMYEISQATQSLYDRRKAKEITYDQEKAMKAEMEQEYVSILSESASYKKLTGLMNKLDGSGFFEKDGLGSTRSGQTYLWNSLNALLGDSGKTPAAEYPKAEKAFTPWGKGGRGGGGGSKASSKLGKTGTEGIKWTPAQARQMAATKSGKYTPVNIRVKLGNAVKKDKSQNYSDRSF